MSDVPKGLGKRAKNFWTRIVADFMLEAHHLALLEQACRALDRIDVARAALETDGLFIPDRYGVLKEHPAVGVEAQSTRLFKGLLRELQLDVAVSDDGYSRPPALPTTGRPKKGAR